MSANFGARSVSHRHARKNELRKLSRYWLPVAALIYTTLRLIFFLATPTLVTADTVPFVDLGLGGGSPLGLFVGMGSRPGFLFQSMLIVMGYPTNWVLDGRSHLYSTTGIFQVALLSLSISAWIFLATAAYRAIEATIARIFVVGVIFTLSCLPAIAVWDRVVMSESLSISLCVAWFAFTIFIVLRGPKPLWAFALVLSATLAIATRPSNGMAIVPVSLIVGVVTFAKQPKSVRRQMLVPVLITSWMLALGVWVLGVAHVTDLKWGHVYDSNRNVALLVTPEYREWLFKIGVKPCLSAVEFSEKQWLDSDTFHWGNVDNFVKKSGQSNCVGTWSDLGGVGPQLSDILFSPSVQFSYWKEHHRLILSGPDFSTSRNFVYMGLVPIPETLLDLNSLMLGSGIFGTICLFIIGLVISLPVSRNRLTMDRIILSLTLLIGTGLEVVMLALADGGDPARHALPWSLLLFIASATCCPLALRPSNQGLNKVLLTRSM